jgi:hypothetical protein
VPHHDGSPHDKHRSSGPRPVKLRSDQYIFQIFIKIFIFKNKLKNLIQTSKFKFSFWGLLMAIMLSNQHKMWRELTKEHSRQALFQLVQWFQRRIPLKDFRAIQKNEGIVKDHPMIIHVQMGSIKSLVFEKKNTCIYSFSQQGHKL